MFVFGYVRLEYSIILVLFIARLRHFSHRFQRRFQRRQLPRRPLKRHARRVVVAEAEAAALTGEGELLLGSAKGTSERVCIGH